MYVYVLQTRYKHGTNTVQTRYKHGTNTSLSLSLSLSLLPWYTRSSVVCVCALYLEVPGGAWRCLDCYTTCRTVHQFVSLSPGCARKTYMFYNAL